VAAALTSPPANSRPSQPSLRRALAGLNVVRPRDARYGRSTLTSAPAPALTGTCPGSRTAPGP
jgi:hypothetical protein